nr:hypothetical protein GCM10020093_088030 [Planobispora longispora]
MAYSQYTVIMQAIPAIFLASQSPYTVAPDLRFRVLPLYLSRPVTIRDYVSAKLAAMTAALFLLLAVPLTVLFVGELVVDMPGPAQTSEYLASLAGAAATRCCWPRSGWRSPPSPPARPGRRRGHRVLPPLLGRLGSPRRDDGVGRRRRRRRLGLADQPVLRGGRGHPRRRLRPGPRRRLLPRGFGVAAAILIMLGLIALSVTALILRYRKAASR